MTTDHRPGPTLTTGERDTDLNDRLTKELVAFNTAATGAADRGTFSVKAADEAGDLVGGLAAWTWGGLCGIELLWVREDSRKDGRGSRQLRQRRVDAVAIASPSPLSPSRLPASISATAIPRPVGRWVSLEGTRTCTCSSR
ncbi:hypothetical protein [Streptomyces sp. NBC_00827]|uniref:hypothetical protein n=1 Tax=Streptomyces sp. NBC_00827 TaxID=2903677 RepID=UPI003869E8FF